MIRLSVFLLLLGFNFLGSSHDLIRYYNGEIKLKDHEILSLCDSIKTHSSSDYLLALAHYQTGVLLRNVNKNFDAYETYDEALNYLLKADTTDIFLHFAILKNQGVILKQYWMLNDAIQKYEQALPIAFKYSISRGLSVKYNLAKAWALKEQEKALRLFMEILDEAKEVGLTNRQAKVYNEIALMFIRSGEHEGAFEYLDKALAVSENDQAKAVTYHNYAHTYYELEQYDQQEEWLEKSLAIRKGADRFVSLMDLGECYLLKNKIEMAEDVLREAEKYYDHQPLQRENLKVFKWLDQVYPDSIQFIKAQNEDLEKIVTIYEKLEQLLKQQAMQQLLTRLENEKISRTQISSLKKLAISGGFIILFIIFSWRIWLLRLRKNIGREVHEIINLGKEQDAAK